MCQSYLAIDREYSRLYLKLEEALINDHEKMLKELRVGFAATEIVKIDFSVNLEVVNGTNFYDPCDDWPDRTDRTTFCPSYSPSAYMWKTCIPFDLHFTTRDTSELQLEDKFVAWMFNLHGSVLSTILYLVDDVWFWRFWLDNIYIDYHDIDLTLRMDRLNCNPSSLMMKCVFTELFSWVSSVL